MAGSKHNIIGDRVDMQLTVRSNDPAVRLQLLDGIDRVARGVAVSMGVPETLMPQVLIPIQDRSRRLRP